LRKYRAPFGEVLFGSDERIFAAEIERNGPHENALPDRLAQPQLFPHRRGEGSRIVGCHGCGEFEVALRRRLRRAGKVGSQDIGNGVDGGEQREEALLVKVGAHRGNGGCKSVVGFPSIHELLAKAQDLRDRVHAASEQDNTLDLFRHDSGKLDGDPAAKGMRDEIDRASVQVRESSHLFAGGIG
jgi:hypothetical protein